MTQGRWSNL